MLNFNDIVLENPPCGLCGDNEFKVLFSAKDILHGMPGEFTVVECLSCNLMRTSPRPTDKSIESYYPANYGPYRSTLVGNVAGTGVLFRYIKLVSNFIFRFNTGNIPNIDPGRMLEIGCASGSFLHKMALKGWDVQGVEFSESAAREAIKHGYKVEIGALENLNLPSNCYDLIVGWMVIEHLHEPLIGLQKLHGSSKKGAHLVLSLPNAGSLEFRIFKRNWYALQVPTHLYHFSPNTITSMLNMSGWHVEKIYNQRTLSNLIASTGYWLVENGFKSVGQKLIEFPENQGLWPYFLYPISCLFALLGQTGRMTVFAKRID
jgi:2-polyprenyl-3-methyl-5-hydroxy-6-metoxy-1,4-benzoquinol methylase